MAPWTLLPFATILEFLLLVSSSRAIKSTDVCFIRADLADNKSSDLQERYLYLLRCAEMGTFPTEDPHTYIDCASHGNKLVATVGSCGDEYFSSATRTCVLTSDSSANVVREERQAKFPTSRKLLAASSSAYHCGSNNLTGIYCFNESHVAVCLGDYSGDSFTGRSLPFACAQDTVCVPGAGCQRNAALLSRKRPFACTDEGRYPDPYSCRIYHDCSSSSATPQQFTLVSKECSRGEVYSIRLGYCVPESDSHCYLGIFCHADMEVGVLLANYSIFFVCTTEASFPGDVSPNFYSCQGQTLFNPAVFACASSSAEWSSLPSPIVF